MSGGLDNPVFPGPGLTGGRFGCLIPAVVPSA